MTDVVTSPPGSATLAGSSRPALVAMLEARSVALVGASPRPGTFGRRLAEEVAKSTSRPRIYPVNPKYGELNGRPCYPSLAELPETVDLALLAVPDAALESQLALAADCGTRSAVIFGSAHDGRERVATVATAAGMELCGAGCMGFVNVSRGLRAIGYTEADPLPDGPVALVTHSGSAFSALLRARRRLGFTLAVSSGQELVTAAPAYLDYALNLPETGVLALVLEAIRDGTALRAVLARAAERDVPVVLLTTGDSVRGKAMVAAHSGALAAADGGWEALARAYGVHRVADLAELADTVELFAAGRRVRARAAGGARRGEGIATVHDSGLERTHVVDMASELGVPFADLGPATLARLSGILDPGLDPANPLDVWGTGADTRELFAGSLAALADDPDVQAVALAVDLVPELDGDESYPLAVLDVFRHTAKPVAVLSNLSSAIDLEAAAQLRAAGVPVLEGTRSGLLALKHLVDHADRQLAAPGTAATNTGAVDPQRQCRGRALLASGPAGAARRPGPAGAARHPGPAGRPGPVGSAAHSGPAGATGRPGPAGAARRPGPVGSAAHSGPAGATGHPGPEAVAGEPLLALLAEYGIGVPRTAAVSTAEAALAAAHDIGYPVVLKTDEPAIAHKSDAGGVLLGVAGPDRLAAAYADLADRLGPRVLVCETVPAGVELALGVIRDHELGPLVVVGAGGVLVELLADRAVALPPVGATTARDLIDGLRVGRLLAGVRGAPPVSIDAVLAAITGLSQLAIELGDRLEALDVNPLICGPQGAVAVDALAIPRQG
jgi:acetate---CoA ligase (ADP-forming)